MSAAVELRELCLGYPGRPVIDTLDGRFEPGSLTAVIGANGAGKSTLLKAIAGLLAPLAGSVQLGLARRRLGYLPQVAQLDREFPISVGEVLAMGAWARLGAWRALRGEAARQVSQALDTVGLAGYEKRLIGELSVGQLQRVLFARLLVQDAELILLDEPFNAVDAQTTEDLLALVRAWHGQGRTVIAVLHDLAQVHSHFPHALLLAGQTRAWGATDQVLRQIPQPAFGACWAGACP